MKSGFSRRDMLKSAAALVLTGIPLDVWALQNGEELVDFSDLAAFRLDQHASSPRVKFFDLRHLTTLTTPENEFFTFHQTDTIHANLKDWRLNVVGTFEKPGIFTLDELKQRPDKRELTVTIECSGNMSIGAANGQISTGAWTGTSLASILNECKLKPETREIAFFGMDMEQYPNSSAETPHGRSVYMQDALHPDAMLAWALNGAPLTPERGFPLRVIIPGWYGVTQIKWLVQIEALDRRYEGPQMSRNYHSVHTPTPDPNLVFETSISKNRLKSVVARVTRRKDAGGKYLYRIGGAAWGGAEPIRAVEISIDGKPWRPARFATRESSNNYAWRLWSMDWNDVTPGPHTLVSRAIDAKNNIQPTLDELRKSIKSLREDNSQWLRKLII